MERKEYLPMGNQRARLSRRNFIASAGLLLPAAPGFGQEHNDLRERLEALNVPECKISAWIRTVEQHAERTKDFQSIELETVHDAKIVRELREVLRHERIFSDEIYFLAGTDTDCYSGFPSFRTAGTQQTLRRHGRVRIFSGIEDFGRTEIPGQAQRAKEEYLHRVETVKGQRSTFGSGHGFYDHLILARNVDMYAYEMAISYIKRLSNPEILEQERKKPSTIVLQSCEAGELIRRYLRYVMDFQWRAYGRNPQGSFRYTLTNSITSTTGIELGTANLEDRIRTGTFDDFLDKEPLEFAGIVSHPTIQTSHPESGIPAYL